jgi:hypothetical protein
MPSKVSYWRTGILDTAFESQAWVLLGTCVQSGFDIVHYVDTSLFDYSITLKKQLAIYKSNALV